MAQKVRIKDIAQLAGVSPGTVDRVIHNRGNVSPIALKAVKEVLEKAGYQPNIHLSAISLRRKYKIVVTIPAFRKGEYWEQIYKGILRATDVYETVQIECKFLFYNQFDLYNCRQVFEQIDAMEPDGVIIGPTFRDETVYLTTRLEDHETPYVYVDSVIEGTMPLGSFASNPHTCGYLTGKLIDAITPPQAEYALFQAIRRGDASANTTILRKQGFAAYFAEHAKTEAIHRAAFSATEPARNEELIGDFFKKHPQVRGAVVLNSRGSVIASYLHKHKIEGVKLIGIDLTDDNIREVRAGNIHFVLGQRPEQQGYLAVKSMIRHLIYGGKEKNIETTMPLDIITRENLDLYSEFSEVAYTELK